MTREEFARFLEVAHTGGASGPEVMLLARVLGTGGVGGRLLPPTTAADVGVMLVDRGDGPTLLGGGPFVPVAPAERTEARAVIDRLGLGPQLPATAAGSLRPDATNHGSLPATLRRPVLVASPADGLRGATDAAFDRGWTARLGSLAMREPPEAAADMLLERSETFVREARSGSSGGTKGYTTFAMATLDLPEGVDDTAFCWAFLQRARSRRTRREMSVGLFRTSGSVRIPADPKAPVEPGGWVVGASSDLEATPVPSETPRPLAMRPGFTDVGLLAMTVWRPAAGAEKAGP